jgi:hypothetical protein
MPVFEDQQAVQQLLSGLNSMQMQAGLMPGMAPMQPPSMYQPPRQSSPAEFSNYLNVQHRNDLAMLQGLPPQYTGVTPVTRTDFAQSLLPGPQLTTGWGLARQQVQGSYNSWMTGTQAVAGLGARAGFGMGMTAVGAGIGGMLGGPMGAAVGGFALPMLADSFVGQGVEQLATLPFRGLIQQRQRAFDLQNTTTQFLRSGAELSPAGAGLTLGGSMDLERNLSRLSRSSGFARDTRGQFNQQDMVKLTQLAGQSGLLDNAQSVDQITRDMGKIGRALTTFMKVMDEPDVQSAMRMMGNMRNLGMSLPDMTSAANNARTFARMAGVSVQGVMQSGMQGAQMFQQMGMSGASGLQAGMAATGTAGLLGGILNPRQLAMLGGREGITQNLTAAAGNVSNIDMLLPGLLRRGGAGLEVDTDALMGLASGKSNIQELARASAQRLRGLGPKGFVEEYSTRRNELRDELMGSLGGQGAILAPMMIARAIQGTGATDFRGGLRMQGLNEQQARTLELANTPEFFRRLQQQTNTENFEQRAQARQRRTAAYEEADTRRGQRVRERTFGEFYVLGRGIRDMGYGATNLFRGEFGEEQDIAEQRKFLGDGELLAVTPGNQLGTEEQRREIEKQVGTEEGRETLFARSDKLNALMRFQNRRRESAVQEQEVTRRNLMTYGTPVVGVFSNYVMDRFMGSEGFAFTDVGRGSIGLGRTVMRNESAGTQWGNYFATGSTERDPGQVEARANDMVEGGQLIEGARNMRVSRERTQDLSRMAGMDVGRYRRVRAIASSAFEQYAQELGEGYWSNSGGFSMEEARKRVVENMSSYGNVDAETARRMVENPEFMKELIRTGAAGRQEEGRATLEKAAAAGGDIRGVREAMTETGARQVAEGSRRGLINRLGLNPDDLEIGQAKQLVNLMSETGPEAEARRKLFRARALSAVGTGEARRKADELRSEVEMSVTEDQYAAAETAVEGVAGSMDRDALQRVGEFTNKDAYWKNRERLESESQKLASDSRYADYTASLMGVLGEEGANVFNRGEKSGKSMELLADFIEKSGGKLRGGKLSDKDIEDIRRGKMDANQLRERVTGQIKYQARAVVEGGQLASEGGPQGQNAVTSQIIDVLAQAAQRDQQLMQGSFGKFDGAVDKFSAATKDLSAAAAALADRNAVQTLNSARNDARESSSNYSLSE